MLTYIARLSVAGQTLCFSFLYFLPPPLFFKEKSEGVGVESKLLNKCSRFLKIVMNNFLLDFVAFGAVLSGVLVITSTNPVISVLFLISIFINAAGYLLLLGVGFIGISYLIVYIGAIAILFLFVVMMLNIRLVEIVSVGTEYTKNLPLGLIVGSLFFFEILSIVPASTDIPRATKNQRVEIKTATTPLLRLLRRS